MVSDPFLVGFFFGLVPAFGFLYILLHRYEGLFNEKRSFFAFFIGMGGGLVATLLQLFLGPGSGRPAVFVGIYPLLFGLINCLVLSLILRMKRFRGRPDTPFYGVGVGLGFGALNVLFLIGNAVRSLAAAASDIFVEAFLLSLLGLYYIGSILIHAAAAAWIGRGVARHNLLPDAGKAVLVEVVYLGGFFLLFSDIGSRLVPPLGLGLSILLIRYILRDVLDEIIPPEIRREMQVHQRRVARGLMRPDPTPNETDPAEARKDDSPAAAPPGSAPPNP
ncbi:MAG TPA: hypothetical protein VI818_05905 [Candidatus Thermoplasmatota archaeon]|nr:hypothetical protein [Candidatus Thermoplasmatota archaeon]